MALFETVPQSDAVLHQAGINAAFESITKRITMMMAHRVDGPDDEAAFQQGVTVGMREALQAVQARWQELEAAPPDPHLDNMPGM